MVCLGDISGFSLPFYKYTNSRNAHECIALLRETCDVVLPGNHDFFAARRIPENSEIFDFPSNWYELDFRKRSELVNGDIWLHEIDDLDPLYHKEDIEFLNSLPEYYVMETERGNILFSHYIFPNLSGFKKGFYIEEKDFRKHFDLMKKKECLVAFTGHAHVRGFYVVNHHILKHYRYRKLKLNGYPACVGIPPVTRHKNRSGFCIFDTKSFEIQTIKI